MNDRHERFEQLAAGHALSALEPEDEQEFLAHLRGCSACERALAEHRETAAHLAYAPDPVALPDGILAGIRAGMATSRPASDRLTPAELVEPVSLEGRRSRRARGLPPAWIGMAAAAVLVLSLGVWNASLRHDQSVAEQRAARLAEAVRLLQVDRRVPLVDDSGRAVAVAVMHDERTVSLVVDGLAVNDASDSTYVLWQTGDTGTRAVGTFDVRGEVDVVRDLQLVTSLQGWKAFAVTREPGRTAPKVPGSLPVANGAVSA